jgi:hypothetical protein
MHTLARTVPISLAAFALIASVSAPTRAVAQSNGALSAPQNSIDARITTLREIIENNDSHILLPVGWHPVTLPFGSIGRGTEPNGQIGVTLLFQSFYWQKDPVDLVRGQTMLSGGNVGFGSASNVLLAGTYQNRNCSPTGRVPGLPGYVYNVCTAVDVTTGDYSASGSSPMVLLSNGSGSLLPRRL